MLHKTVRRAKASRNTPDLLRDQLQEIAGPQAQISLEREKPWASITFSGTRYRFQIGSWRDCADESTARSIDKLADHIFDLPGQFVADILVHERCAEEPLVVIEILTIADPVSEKN